jgi:hypothetical protein
MRPYGQPSSLTLSQTELRFPQVKRLQGWTRQFYVQTRLYVRIIISFYQSEVIAPVDRCVGRAQFEFKLSGCEDIGLYHRVIREIARLIYISYHPDESSNQTKDVHA